MKQYAKMILVSLVLSLFVGPTLLAQTDETNEGQSYVIQSNDSLWKLAVKYLGDGNAYVRIVEATDQKAAEDDSYSSIRNPNAIRPGQQIWIPVSADAVVVESTIVEAEGSKSADVPETNQAPASATTPSIATSTPNLANASVSGNPNGHLAFSFWNNSGDRCTYETNIISVPDCLNDATTCQATRRIFPLNNVSEPALSPDGKRLAFRGWGEPLSDNSPFIGCAAAHPHRYIGNSTLEGSSFKGTGGFWEDSHPDWSPDGNRIVFDSKREGNDVDLLFAIGANGKNEENIFIIGQHPSFAPDNQRIVYRGCDLSGNHCGLWLASAHEVKSWDRGKNMIGPVVESGDVAHPDWSPTREEIVYQRNESGNWNLWIVNADGSDDRRLSSGAGLEGLPAFSPDGNWVAYLTHNGQNWELRIVSRTGSDDRSVFTYDGGIYALPLPAEPYGVRDWLDEQISWSQ